MLENFNKNLLKLSWTKYENPEIHNELKVIKVNLGNE